MTGQKLIFFVIEWLVLGDGANAYMSGCIGGFCFISSAPTFDTSNRTNTISSDAAQQWCRNNGTRLIEITNKDIQNAMSGFLNGISSTYYYSDRLFTNGKRSSGSWTWVIRNTPNGLSIGGANDASYAYAYLQLTTSGFAVTASRPADAKQGYICENEGQCTNTAGFSLNNRCYKSYSNEALSWYDARKRCLDRGGDLASFEYIGSNQGLSVLNGSWLTPSAAYWIDLRREWWTWRDSQTDIKYSNWLNGYPVTYLNDPNDCLCLQANSWSWTICRCQESKPFICFSDIRPSSTTANTFISISTSTSSSTTTTTSTITTTSASHYSNTTSSIKTIGNKSTSSMTSRATSGGYEVPLPTVPTTVTSRANNCACDAVSVEKPSRSVEVGVAIGLGIGIPLIIVIAVLAIVITILRKQLRRAHLLLETNKKHQPGNGDTHELNDKTGNPYESLQPITESAATSDGLHVYQSLDPSTKTDSIVISSNI